MTHRRWRSARPAGPRAAHAVGFAVLLVLMLGGCADHIRLGRRVSPGLLETALSVGVSTEADVLQVLGPPTGKGRAYLPIDLKLRTLWSYYFEEGAIAGAAVTDARRMFIWVYFDAAGRYDGYLWFSSLSDDAPAASGSSPPMATGGTTVTTDR